MGKLELAITYGTILDQIAQSRCGFYGENLTCGSRLFEFHGRSRNLRWCNTCTYVQLLVVMLLLLLVK